MARGEQRTERGDGGEVCNEDAGEGAVGFRERGRGARRRYSRCTAWRRAVTNERGRESFCGFLRSN